MNRSKKPNRNRLRKRASKGEARRLATMLTPAERAEGDMLFHRMMAECFQEEAAAENDPAYKHYLEVTAKVAGDKANKAEERLERIQGKVLNSAPDCGKVGS